MINKVILLGRLGKDPEIRQFENDLTKANFSLATSETFKNKMGEKEERTEWHNIVIWGQIARVAEKFLKKGDLVYLEGRIQSRSYDDKDGVKKYITEINCDKLTMVGGKKDSVPATSTGNANNSSSADSSTYEPPIVADDDLPF